MLDSKTATRSGRLDSEKAEGTKPGGKLDFFKEPEPCRTKTANARLKPDKMEMARSGWDNLKGAGRSRGGRGKRKTRDPWTNALAASTSAAPSEEAARRGEV